MISVEMTRRRRETTLALSEGFESSVISEASSPATPRVKKILP